MADILDAANQSNEPTGPGATVRPPADTASAVGQTSSTTDVNGPVPPPHEPTMSVPSPLTPSSEPAPEPNAPAPATPLTEEAKPKETEPEASSVMESVLEATKETPKEGAKEPLPVEPEPTVSAPPPPLPKKGLNKGVILSVLLLLLVTLPLIIYYASQQRQIAEIRSRATGPYPCTGWRPTCSAGYDITCINGSWQCLAPTPPATPPGGGGNGCPTGWRCEKIYTEATTCAETWPGPPPAVQQPCKLTDSDAFNGTCCIPPTGGSPTPTPTPSKGGGGGTPPPGTPTLPPPVPQCQNIKVYKGGKLLTGTDLANLQSGDNVNIVVSGTGATKGQVRVNGSAWTESTTTDSTGGFVVPFTVPSGVTNFTIEGELFINGAWQ